MGMNDNAAKQIARQIGVSMNEAKKAVQGAYVTNDLLERLDSATTGTPESRGIMKRSKYR